ncbi:carbonic anhydrase [Zhihengliuella salsuginis]|uniref:Carbonic anhydrase 2 n=1 Tax=Zhihengliuella salsuginis TaxID=578222 RepID=A0ABQ3GKY6_9MICC|nr:carbonic anhydrase [Zhihengliuella salsuginis]GHD12497.1 carbonic anhydrase 2 [Zhihengliuella salsuginis]
MNDTAHVPTVRTAAGSSGATSRRNLLAGVGALAALSGLAACAPAAAPESTPTPSTPVPGTPEEALERLKTGNERFAASAAKHPNQGADARAGTAEHQAPWALVHGCVDSRVAPELVFDQGIGDIFTTRTAGAVLDDTLVGSMEFAAGSPYEVPVLVILGHTGCGAVTATVEAVAAAPDNPRAPGEVADIVDEIAPVVRAADPVEDQKAFIDAVVAANTLAVAEALVERSQIIRDAVEAGRTRVIAAVYDLDTGLVDWEPRRS